ncbi:MAG: DUF5309 family protein [Thermodesulfobacteriota bacterium]
MAIPTNTFTTYEAIGIREDLTDIVTTISPVDTWVTSNTGNKRSTNRYHEWQRDALAAAAVNKVIEGDSATATAVTPRSREGNYNQILRKTWQISDTDMAVNTAGGSEDSQQLTKHLAELARDIEYALVINATSASGASGTARQMKGMLGWISTNNETGAGTANEALTETMLNDALSDIWAAGGKPSNILVGGFNKRKISNFSTNTRNVAATAKELTAAVDIYESDFGRIAVRLHHQLNTTAAGTLIILGEMSHWNKAWLRPVKREVLARDSASTKYMVEAELTLESLSEAGHGKITLLTSA